MDMIAQHRNGQDKITYSKCPTPKTAFRSVSIQVQLNQELKVHTNTIVTPKTAFRSVSIQVQLNQELKVHTNTIVNILNVIPNLVLYFNRGIQDASLSLTKKNYSDSGVYSN